MDESIWKLWEICFKNSWKWLSTISFIPDTPHSIASGNENMTVLMPITSEWPKSHKKQVKWKYKYGLEGQTAWQDLWDWHVDFYSCFFFFRIHSRPCLSLYCEQHNTQAGQPALRDTFVLNNYINSSVFLPHISGVVIFLQRGNWVCSYTPRH